MEFFENGGGAGMQLFYKGPDSGDEQVIIPSDVFTHIPAEHRPPLEQTTCPDYKRVVLRLDLVDGLIHVGSRMQLDENQHHDFNEASSYEVCNGMEQVPLTTAGECSYGNRACNDRSKPCLVRLEQRTFKEASPPWRPHPTSNSSTTN